MGDGTAWRGIQSPGQFGLNLPTERSHSEVTVGRWYCRELLSRQGSHKELELVTMSGPKGVVVSLFTQLTLPDPSDSKLP